MPPFTYRTNRPQSRLLRIVKNKTQLILLLAGTSVLLYFALSSKGFVSRIRVENELTEKQERVIELKRDIQTLRRERDLLRDDLATIEHAARESHGMIRPGEIVYRILPADRHKKK